MAIHHATVAVSGILAGQGIGRDDMCVRTGRSGRTAVCLIGDETVARAEETRTGIEKALEAAGFQVVRWAYGVFWCESQAAAAMRTGLRPKAA